MKSQDNLTELVEDVIKENKKRLTNLIYRIRTSKKNEDI